MPTFAGQLERLLRHFAHERVRALSAIGCAIGESPTRLNGDGRRCAWCASSGVRVLI